MCPRLEIICTYLHGSKHQPLALASSIGRLAPEQRAQVRDRKRKLDNDQRLPNNQNPI